MSASRTHGPADEVARARTAGLYLERKFELKRTCFVVSFVIGLIPVLCQEPAKKKPGFLDRLNEKLDKLNQTLDPNAPKPQRSERPSKKETPVDDTKVAAKPGIGAGRTEPCTKFDWTAPTSQDPLLALPTTYQRQYEGDFPEALEEAGSYSLERFGRTTSIRTVFAPRKYRVLYRVNGENKVVEPRDAVQPFENHLTLSGGQLFAGFCNEKAEFHDAWSVDFLPQTSTIRISMSDSPNLYIKGGGRSEPFCSKCYFVNKVFHSGIEGDRYVILVNPETSEGPVHWLIRIQPWSGQTVIRSVGNLCKMTTPTAFCGDEAAFEKLEVTQEPSDPILFPGKMENRWYVRCASERCPKRRLADIANNRWN